MQSNQSIWPLRNVVASHLLPSSELLCTHGQNMICVSWIVVVLKTQPTSTNPNNDWPIDQMVKTRLDTCADTRHMWYER